MPRSDTTSDAEPTPPRQDNSIDALDFPVSAERAFSMDEMAAKTLAEVIGGEVWQTGGHIHVVSLRCPDGSIVVFSDDLVAERGRRSL